MQAIRHGYFALCRKVIIRIIL